MQAIILAAGMGKRLGEYTKNNTKCMVPVNGIPLIDRVLEQLSHLKLKRIIIIVGYKAQELMEHIGNRYARLNIEFVINPIYYKTNNIYSLAMAKEQMQEDDTILLESDLIFDDSMLDLLLSNPFPNLALVAKYETWMDGTMVCIDNDCNIVNFVTKAAFNYRNVDQYYKTVNIYKFSQTFSTTKYIPFLEAYSKAVGNNEYYENVLRIISFLNCHDLKALPIQDEKWYEIDDKQDLDIAEALFATDENVLRKYYHRYGGYWRFPRMLDFCYLVNPFFPSQRLVDEMTANFRTLLTEYPSGQSINTLLASKCWGVKEEYIIPGNGAAELIKLLLEEQTGKLGIVRPTFEEYPNRYTSSLIEAYTPKCQDYRYSANDLMEHFEKHPVQALIIINPDNPSGNFIPQSDILNLAQWCEKRKTRLIVDESFVDFSDDRKNASLLHDELLEEYPHMVVIKSISKSFGVPGLRLGILASADTRTISLLKKQVPIWNLNSFAEFFMQILTKYEPDYELACAKFVEERKWFKNQLHTVNFIRVIPSQANYFLVEVLPPYKAADIVIRMLKEHNILTRDCSSKEGLADKSYMRIAIRNRDDNQKLINALKTLE